MLAQLPSLNHNPRVGGSSPSSATIQVGLAAGKKKQSSELILNAECPGALRRGAVACPTNRWPLSRPDRLGCRTGEDRAALGWGFLRSIEVWLRTDEAHRARLFAAARSPMQTSAAPQNTTQRGGKRMCIAVRKSKSNV